MVCELSWSTEGTSQSGRPVEVDNHQIETLIENNQCSIMMYSRQSQNIQISKVIHENEKCLLFYR